jgi:hypothetical protein
MNSNPAVPDCRGGVAMNPEQKPPTLYRDNQEVGTCCVCKTENLAVSEYRTDDNGNRLLVCDPCMGTICFMLNGG